MKIFISYRRSDSKAIARLISEELRDRYGADTVFLDVSEIEPGAEFPETIRHALAKSDVFLALIGPDWVRKGAFGETDYVRLEVEAAFAHQLEVLPLLVEGGEMPSQNVLPESMQLISLINAIPVDTGGDFQSHMQRLYDALENGEKTRDRLNVQHRLVLDARRAAHALDREGWQFSADVAGDQYVFLLTLKRFLGSTKDLFDIQVELADYLLRGIKHPTGGMDDAIRAVADKIPEERYWLRRRLRKETDNMRKVHGALLRLMSRNRSLFALIPDLHKLYEHLSMWVAKYECLRDDETMCLVFVGIKQKKRFPRKVERAILQRIDELDQKHQFR
ncbi:MAG: toll/interleukin-1 receptor domain-containing protein [Pseudomonadota bacterium]